MLTTNAFILITSISFKSLDDLPVPFNLELCTPSDYNMKLATTAIFLYSFASVAFAAGCTSSEPPPQGFYCYRETDCASHSDWPSESGHLFKLSGAAPAEFKARELDRGSRIDLRALFNCSTIEDVERRLACDEYIEVRTSMRLVHHLVTGA